MKEKGKKRKKKNMWRKREKSTEVESDVFFC